MLPVCPADMVSAAFDPAGCKPAGRTDLEVYVPHAATKSNRPSRDAAPLLWRLEERGVEDRPEMDDPPEQDKPENRRQTKLDDRHQQSALEQLSQPGDKETAECCEHIAR